MDLTEPIEKHIKSGEYDEALKKIDDLLSQEFDLQSAKNEELYSKLMHLRVAANTFLGKNDDVILDSVRKDKFPSVRTYNLGKNEIVLIYKSQFLQKSGAYVNTIHSKSLFKNPEAYSARYEFLKRIGEEKINAQLKAQKIKLHEGNFIVLEHPDLITPFSYHIVYDRKHFEPVILEKAIENVFDDAVKRKLSSINIFPLLFDMTYEVPDDKKKALAEKIAGSIAEIIVRYLEANRNTDVPEIQFNFVKTDTMQTFDRAFYRAIQSSKTDLYVQKVLSIKQKALMEGANTSDSSFIELLKEMSFSLDDDSTILLTGETGVGKTFIADIIHRNSSRAGDKIVKINCATIERQHLISTLFGWKKGSFTGALDDGKGGVEEADRGTLFMDEIGYADLDVQRALLKFVEEGIYTRFGDPEEKTANVRFIFGTNADLKRLVQLGQFQEDLYYRISKRIFEIPPLRKRKCDIISFAEDTVKKLNSLNEQNGFALELDEKAKNKLTEFKWPGNIRQLIAYIDTLYIRCKIDNISTLTIDMICKYPPEDESFNKLNKYSQLRNLLEDILKEWDTKDGNMFDNLIGPILAHLYTSNKIDQKKISHNFIGIDGSGGTKAIIDRHCDKYEEVKNKFNL
ncbi:MAG TPA: sigma 54-interacting transcriptional regulator [Ignavibacteriales bacterium]|nr:sigma 54-interacting transcriptional regulator [Ignavibacteriales bacterium]